MPLKRAAPHLCPCLLAPPAVNVGAAAWWEQSQRKPRSPHPRVPWCTLWLLKDGAGRPRHEDPITHPLQHLHFCSSSRQRWGRCWRANALRITVPPSRVGVHPGHPGTPQTTKPVWACSLHRLRVGRVCSQGPWRPQDLDAAQEQARRGHTCVCVLAVLPGTLQHVRFR